GLQRNVLYYIFLMEPSARVFAERLLSDAARFCRWPDGQPLRLTGLDNNAPIATVLGGFVFDLQRQFVRCHCSSCAGLPVLVGEDVPDDETCIMSLLAFAFHASGPALELAEAILHDKGLDEQAEDDEMRRLVMEVLFVLDVPYNDKEVYGEVRPPRRLGSLPLSEFLRQSAQAAGGSSLLGQPLLLHVFTAAAAADRGAARDGAAVREE
ncbi:hypothetical protein Agub_g809, partial [Astrephomene gubernaculifera]